MLMDSAESLKRTEITGSLTLTGSVEPDLRQKESWRRQDSQPLGAEHPGDRKRREGNSRRDTQSHRKRRASHSRSRICHLETLFVFIAIIRLDATVSCCFS